jgi:hypothetical protein
MYEYRLSPLFFSQMRRRIWTISLPIILFALLGGIWVGGQTAQSATPFLIIVPLFLIVLIFSFVRGMKQQQKYWSSYCLILDETSIKKVQDGLPEITIGYGEITKITESTRIGLAIQALSPPRQIIVPATLDDYSQLRSDLASRHPFESAPETRAKWAQLSPLIVVLATIILFIVTFVSASPYVSAITGILLFTVLAASFVSIQRNTQVTKIQKWSSCFIFFPLLAVIVRVVIDILIII